MSIVNKINVLDHGYVHLQNVAGPIRRIDQEFDAHDRDPANAARMSFDASSNITRPLSDDLKLAQYLYKNKHTTPFEMITIWLEMKMPIFVARQFVRHRTVSINEVSARYTQLPNEFYIPEIEVIGTQSTSNKQGRNLSKSQVSESQVSSKGNFRLSLIFNSHEAYKTYEYHLDKGIPKELARCLLPLNIYTKWLWKQDLHNMMHFLRLRMHEHAQYEARQYAKAINTLLHKVLPNTMEMFDKE